MPRCFCGATPPLSSQALMAELRVAQIPRPRPTSTAALPAELRLKTSICLPLPGQVDGHSGLLELLLGLIVDNLKLLPDHVHAPQQVAAASPEGALQLHEAFARDRLVQPVEPVHKVLELIGAALVHIEPIEHAD